ncbi:hypothetical protein N0V90_000453 [Kalmusia sp. IMI 367209]|nr:hypothetical protein N0V90_000453 [Kalmusia sp. IMI 367209]
MIQQTVYSKEGRTGINFLNSVKTALKALAAINDERTFNFPLKLDCPDNDVFIPFDLESTWSAALVLLITPVVDPSLFRDTEDSLQTAFDILSDMAAVGNSVAACRKAELEQLKETLRALENIGQHKHVQIPLPDGDEIFVLPMMDANQPDTVASIQPEIDYMSAHSFDMEEVLSSEQLEAVANAMNLNGLDWTWAASSLDQLDPSIM